MSFYEIKEICKSIDALTKEVRALRKVISKKQNQTENKDAIDIVMEGLNELDNNA